MLPPSLTLVCISAWILEALVNLLFANSVATSFVHLEKHAAMKGNYSIRFLKEGSACIFGKVTQLTIPMLVVRPAPLLVPPVHWR